jgi:predicted lipase
MISHSQVLEIVALPMLVYDYSKSFKLDNNQTIEGFLDSSTDVLEKLSPTRQEVLKNIKSYAPHGRVIDFISDEDTDLQVAITISEKTKRISIVFRGSESKSDWYYDLQFFKRQLHDDVYVHKGFWNQLHINENYEKIKKILDELLAIEENKDFEIIITGHSLGAALSTLFGYEYSREIPQKVTVVSFASPRVGDEGWRKAFDAQENLTHYRISNNRDVVTAAPMFWYKHVGINIHISESKSEIFRNYNYNTWWKYSLFNCFSVSDHDIDLYYQNLKKNPWLEDF